VEVYNCDPRDNPETAVRINCGYISDAGTVFDQLCDLLPLEKWRDVYCCTSPEDGGCKWIIITPPEDGNITEQDATRSTSSKEIRNIIFHNELFEGQEKLVLVIVAKFSPYKFWP
jgi:hypothetical protein